MSESKPARTITGEDEVVDLCRDLIRIDSSNYGDHSGPGERAAAEYVAEKLAEVGLEPQIFESHPGRASTVARIAGEDPSRPALLIHGHTDVVPANADDWTHHPFSGEVADGCVWGRGAVDMKDMDAMTLAVVRDRLRSGRRPPRDVVLAFLADEEAGGVFGARHLVDNHPDLFEGVTEAVVYGVDVPGCDGKAGMAAVVSRHGLDVAGLARHLAERLPAYARPVFIRLSAELSRTETFKPTKQALVEEGCDPAVCPDPILVLASGGDGYAPLDAETYRAIIEGRRRL